MAKIIRVAGIAVLSIVIQLAVFLFLDRKAAQLMNPALHLDSAYQAGYGISGAQEIRLSYNNKFLSFIRENALVVIDLSKNKIVFTTKDDSGQTKCLGYNWLPDGNSLVYLTGGSERPGEPARPEQPVILYSLDIDTQTPGSFAAEYQGVLERIINWSMVRVLDMALSTYTNNLYILFEDSSRHHQLIEIDIMKNINRIDLPEDNITAMFLANKSGTLFLESKTGKGSQIYSITDSGKREILSAGSDEVLLGCREETAYLGTVKNQVLQEILVCPGPDRDSKKRAVKRSSLWRGAISLTRSRVLISPAGSLLIQGPGKLDIIGSDGDQGQVVLPAEHLTVLSGSGELYLEIIPKAEGFTYFWRSVEPPES